MKRPFSARIWRDGNWFVSQCLEVDVASKGQTEDEALENLREAVELQFEPPVATQVAVTHGTKTFRGCAMAEFSACSLTQSV